MELGDHVYKHNYSEVNKKDLYKYLEMHEKRIANMNVLQITEEIFEFGFMLNAIPHAETQRKYQEQYVTTVKLYEKNCELEKKLIKLSAILESNGLGKEIVDDVQS